MSKKRKVRRDLRPVDLERAFPLKTPLVSATSALPNAPPSAPPNAPPKALMDAYRGVKPIAQKHSRVQPAPPPVSRAQRATDPGVRLGARAAVQFTVQRDEPFIEGRQRGVSEKVLRPLASSAFEPQATLDLHGLHRVQAVRMTEDFVRLQRQAGARHLLIIVGKGTHSKDGVPVLREAVIDTLTQSGVAQLVQAFASAHNQHGGSGALAVMLG